MTDYGMRKELEASFDDTIEKAITELKVEGFGVLTDIDVKKTLKEKIDVDFKRYRILGACNPPLAHRVLDAEPDIGVMLPCNVIVYEREGGGTSVVAFDPMIVVKDASDEVREVAQEVRQRLARVLERM